MVIVLHMQPPRRRPTVSVANFPGYPHRPSWWLEWRPTGWMPFKVLPFAARTWDPSKDYHDYPWVPKDAV